MESAIYQPKMVRLPWKIWPLDLTLAVTLTFNFRGQIWNLLYLSQKWFNCHKIESTHIDWTDGLNDHQVWPWSWPWKMRCKDLPDSDQGDFRCRRAVDSSSYKTRFLLLLFWYKDCLSSYRGAQTGGTMIEFLILRALKNSMLHKNIIFQWMFIGPLWNSTQNILPIH